MSELTTSEHPRTGDFSPRPVTPAPPVATIDAASANHSGYGSSLLYNLVIPLLLLAAGAGVVFALGSVKPKTRPAADMTRAGRLRALPPVRVVDVRSLQSEAERLELRVDGTVVPFHEAHIASEVAGQIKFKSEQCEAGSFVSKGQLLMEIDPTDYELEVESLSRQQEQAYEALGEVDQEMVNVKRLIDVATDDVALQQREVSRQESLPAGFSSAGDLDRAKRALLQANQQQVSYENQFDLLGKRRLRLEASERLAATQLKVAKVNLDRTRIVAPMDGVIVSEDAELNTFVARGTTVVTIEDVSKVEVATRLRMDQLHWVLDQADNREATASASSRGYDLPKTPAIIEYEVAGREGDVYRWKGRLSSYDGIGLDPNTRTVPVRVVVDDPRQFYDANGDLRTTEGPTPLVRGMYVRVKLLLRPRTPLVVIPAEALKPGNRVWEFVPDESVLDLSESQTKVAASNEVSEPAGALQAGMISADEQTFDPTKWSPGRVVVRRSILPVDALSVAGLADTSETGDAERRRKDRRWVCEVRDEGLSGESFVVVSPLGTSDDETLAARVLAQSLATRVPGERQVSTETARENLQ